MIIRGENNDNNYKFWYFAHENEQAAIDGSTSVWDWSAAATSAATTELRPPEFMDHQGPLNAVMYQANRMNSKKP